MRPFFVIWGGQALSLLGSQLVQFSLIWWLTEKTGSGTVLALAAIAGLVPSVVFGPFAGVLVDRWNRRLTMMAMDALVALATIVLAILFLTGNVQIWQVYAIMFVRSLAGTFQFPAMQASTTLMVPERNLARVQGLNQMLQGGLNIVAAPLGALLISTIPMQGILSIDISTAAIAILTLFFVTIPQPARAEEVAGEPVWRSLRNDLAEGLRYVVSWRGLLIIIGMAMVLNLILSPSFVLLPLLVTDYFGGGVVQLGWVESAFGLGVLIGGLLLSVWGGFKRRILTSLLGLIGLGIGVMVVGLTPSTLIGVAIAAMFLVGVTNSLSNGPLFAIMQATIDPAMQGRVFTLLASGASAMMPIGLIIAGPLADTIGVEKWFVLGGAASLAMGIAGFFLPSVMSIEDGPPVESGLAAGSPVAADLSSQAAD